MKLRRLETELGGIDNQKRRRGIGASKPAFNSKDTVKGEKNYADASW
jgi:hypothetical protein